MAQNVSYNGGAYVIPDVGDTVWGASLTSYLVALSTGSLQKSGGLFTLTADADFGASFGIKSAYFKSRGALIAQSGILRLANLEALSWRNAANSADITLTVDASGNLLFNGVAVPVAAIGAANTVLTSNGTTLLYQLLANANISASAAIALNKLAALATGRLLESDGSGVITVSTSSGYIKTTTGAPAYSSTIPRADVATGSIDHVVINSGTGALSSEATLSPLRGGNGVANNAAATLTRSGNFGLTLTTTGVTNVTLPTSGTLATVVGASLVTADTPGAAAAGRGTTDTCIRRFTVTSASTTDITVATTLANGTTFTINTAGLYAMSYVDNSSTTSIGVGISVNVATPATTSVALIPTANRLISVDTSAASFFGSVSVVARLAASDVIRAHTDTNASATISRACFRIERIG